MRFLASSLVVRLTGAQPFSIFKNQIDQDIREGNEVGVTGTPAFFINGRSLEGAQPFDAFKRLIDEELAAKKR